MNKEKIMSWVNSHKMLSVFIGVIVFVILFSAITPNSPKAPAVTENKVTTEEKVVFDVPSLLNKNIEEYRTEEDFWKAMGRDVKTKKHNIILNVDN